MSTGVPSTSLADSARRVPKGAKCTYAPAGFEPTGFALARLLGRRTWAAALGAFLPLAGFGAQATLSWVDNSPNETGFKIERATGSGAFAQIATVGANIQTYIDPTVVTGTVYYYRVRAYNQVGNSGYTNTAMTGPNTAPTISAVADVAVDEDLTTGALAFTVGDLETAAGSLTMAGSSSNQTLVPNSAITFGGSGANRTVTVAPAANQNGFTTITLTVSDGNMSTTESFVVTVNAVNDRPTVSAVSDRVIAQDSTTGAVAFTVGDVETAAGSLTVSGSSSNQTLVPNSAIVFGGSGASRTVTVTPASGQIGAATITIAVSDGALAGSTSFLLTVNNAAATGLVAAYGFNEGTGTTASDASGNGNTGTLSGATWNSAGRFGQALSFNGTNAKMIANNSASLNLTSAATLEAWVCPSVVGGWRDVIYKGTDDIYYLMGSSDNSSRPAFRGKFASAPVYGSVSLPLNTWTHLAGTYDGTTMRLFVNGVEVASRAQTGSITTSSGPLTIGGDSLYGQYFSGRIDEVRIYNRALSASEIQVDMSTAVGSSTNTAPTISNLPDQAINEDTGTSALAFTVGDAQTAAGSLTVTGVSSNTAVVPNANIVFGGSGANRTVTVTPSGNTSGSATITVTVSDGSLTSSDSFVLTVNAVNDAPSISDIADLAINEDAATGALVFTVGDVETAAGSLTVTGISSNPALVPNANIVFGGSGANRTVTVTPSGNASGSATITVTVSDGTLTASDSFVVTVNAVNDAPSISDIADLAINEDTATGALVFTVGDVETAAGSLTVTGTSSNTALVPNANIVFGGSGANRTVTVTPSGNASGSATITVTVSDGSLTSSDSFVLTVNSVNDAPSISDIADLTINEDAATGSLVFTVGDVETAAGSLTVTGTSSNTALVPNANIVFGGSGASRSVTVTPAANQSGVATITVTVSDGSATASDQFTLTVTAINDAPTISTIANQTTATGTAVGPLNLSVADVETAAASLTVSASSSNTTLLPSANIVFGGSGGTRTVTATPAAGEAGTSTVTLTVSDGALTASSTFLLTVNAPANSAPTISSIANTTIDQDTNTGALAFSVGDAETAVGSLTVTAASSNTTLVPNASIVLGGSGADRTVTIAPAAGQAGTSTITLTVSDGSLAASSSFVLTVLGNALPAPWQEIDVGTPGAAGSATFSSGVFTIDGSGDDISGRTDAFHYVFQPATGDCEIVARLSTIENTNFRAKAGVLIRETTAEGARYAAVLLTPDDGVRFQRRSTTGGTTSTTRIGGVTAPEWLKVSRAGNTLRGYYSSNGTNWTLIGTQTITMGSTVTIGLGVCSRNDGTLNTATISNVTAAP